MSAHTPETWEAVGCEVRTAVTAEDRRGWGVATTLHGTEASKRHEHARLIAAAPDMYEALCALVAADVLPLYLGNEAREAVAAAVAAIAKAEGMP